MPLLSGIASLLAAVVMPAHPALPYDAGNCSALAPRMSAYVYSECARKLRFGSLGGGKGKGGLFATGRQRRWEAFKRHNCFHAMRPHAEAAMLRAADADAAVRAVQAESSCWSSVFTYPYLNTSIRFGEFSARAPSDAVRRERLVHPSLAWETWMCPATAAIDIGGFLGDTALPIAAVAGASGAVLSFEWNVISYMSVVLQAALNPSLRILPANVGVDARDRYDAKRLHRYVNVPAWVARELPAIVPHLSLIKIDVDDFNEAALESLLALPKVGAAAADARRRPVVKYEWYQRARNEGCGAESQRLWATAARLGYEVHAGDGTPLPTCQAAKEFARRLGKSLRQFGGENLLSDVMLLPPGVTMANRQQFCPPPLPAAALATLPRLPTPAQMLPEAEQAVRAAELRPDGRAELRHKAGRFCTDAWMCG